VPGQGRLGDKANVPLDAHGCPACPHPGIGPAIQGSPDVNVNRRPALRVDDPGVHAACCGANTWTATKGSPTVIINGKGAHRMGDQNRHCGGMGQLIEGSPNVIVGGETSSGSGAGGGGRSSTAAAGGAGGSAGGSGGGGNAGSTGAGGGSSSGQASASPGAAAAPAAPTPAPIDEHQIEVLVVNTRGKPQAAVEFDLRLPDGAEKVGTTGADGYIRISGLTQTGNCKLDFPTIVHAGAVPPTQPSRIRFVDGGVTVAIGTPATVELPPRNRRVRMTGFHFDTDKTFLQPAAMHGIRRLTAFCSQYSDLRMLVTGHTDTVGTSSYNVGLSTERADSIVAFLEEDADAWLAWYTGKPHSKHWGTKEDQYMLATLPEGKPPYYAGAIDGIAGAATEAALKQFQGEHGLPTRGSADRTTRRALISDYMALQGTSLAGGAPMLTHGCGPYHPAVFTGPNIDEPRNRRVEIFLFDDQVEPKPVNPCNDCAQYPEWVKQTVLTHDIEHDDASLDIVMTDSNGQPVPKIRFLITAVDGATREGVLDDNGFARVEGIPEGHVDIAFPDLDAPAWSRLP
jgi:outer membrane protein OmpA-like peptidoglycan-associated protein/uncharacterized Zn-binding protein involved in type VI secretion